MSAAGNANFSVCLSSRVCNFVCVVCRIVFSSSSCSSPFSSSRPSQLVSCCSGISISSSFLLQPLKDSEGSQKSLSARSLAIKCYSSMYFLQLFLQSFVLAKMGVFFPKLSTKESLYLYVAILLAPCYLWLRRRKYILWLRVCLSNQPYRMAAERLNAAKATYLGGEIFPSRCDTIQAPFEKKTFFVQLTLLDSLGIARLPSGCCLYC
jgi:hypothetical protein